MTQHRAYSEVIGGILKPSDDISHTRWTTMKPMLFDALYELKNTLHDVVMIDILPEISVKKTSSRLRTVK